MPRLSIILFAWILLLVLSSQEVLAEFRAGAAVVDISPQSFPVFINGGMTSSSAIAVSTPVHARAIVMEDDGERIALVVVDSCMLQRSFLDEVKAMASGKTGIRPDRMLIAATHAHSAPAAMSCLGTDADEKYIPYLRLKLVETIEAAAKNVEPARVGWGVRNAAYYTAVRRWIRRPDRIIEDPFGNKTVRANMHAGREWQDVIGEAGPEDPDLSILSIQSKEGRPIAVLGNFSMHYFSGEKPVSADYFGLFSEGLKSRIAPQTVAGKPAFIGIMSHGCSGDIWRLDYTKQTPIEFETIKIDAYTEGLLDIAMSAYHEIQYDENVDLAMAEARLHLKYRVPDLQRLKWAQAIVDRMGGLLPKTTEEVYAREQVLLHERQETDVVVQALRIGTIAIASTPTETYALTGHKLKLQSPLKNTMVIELANGGDGYIPPPEQHVLGGYNTWAARSAGLEIEAEPKIAEAALELLEQVCKQSRKPFKQSRGSAVEEALASKPIAYWRMDETAGPRAVDSSGSNLDGIYEPGVVFFLEGPAPSKYCLHGEVNRAVHMAGGRMRARVPSLGDRYSVSMWIWNGMPLDGRDVAGWMFGRGRDHALRPLGDSLGMVGKGDDAGKLIFQSANRPYSIGRSVVPRWTWAHVQFVRTGDLVQVFLNQSKEPEIQMEATFDLPDDTEDIFVGGRGNRESSWEGRIDEVVVHRLRPSLDLTSK